MKFKSRSKFIKKRIQMQFEDSLRWPYVKLDEPAQKALSGLLSSGEKDQAEFPVSVLTREKLVLICDHPERIKEAVLVDENDPAKVYRLPLGLKGKEHSRDA